MGVIEQWINELLRNDNCNGDSNNKNQLLKWAALSSFFTLLSDLISFIIALTAAQESSNSNCCPVKAQVDSLEKKIAEKNQANLEIIKILEEKIHELKNTM